MLIIVEKTFIKKNKHNRGSGNPELKNRVMEFDVIKPS